MVAIGVGCSCHIVEFGVAFRPCEEVCGRVDERTEQEQEQAKHVRRFGPEATQPWNEKREALESDHDVEHVLEEVESGGHVDEHATIVARQHGEGKLQIARRVAHERDGDHK